MTMRRGLVAPDPCAAQRRGPEDQLRAVSAERRPQASPIRWDAVCEKEQLERLEAGSEQCIGRCRRLVFH
jgi:hypothetical protein